MRFSCHYSFTMASMMMMAVMVLLLLLIGLSTTTTALAKQQQQDQQQRRDAIVVAPPRRALLLVESVPGVVSAVQGAGGVVVEGTKAVGTRIATAAANSGIGNGAIVEGARSAASNVGPAISNAGGNAVGAVQNAGNAVEHLGNAVERFQTAGEKAKDAANSAMGQTVKQREAEKLFREMEKVSNAATAFDKELEDVRRKFQSKYCNDKRLTNLQMSNERLKELETQNGQSRESGAGKTLDAKFASIRKTLEAMECKIVPDF